MGEVFTNKNPKTLAAAIVSSGALTFTLSDVVGLPVVGNGSCIIGSEIILVTYDGTTSPVIARGQEGTTATTHLISTDVNFIISAGALGQFGTDIIAGLSGYGAHSSRPAAGVAGRIWRDNDSPTWSRDNGSSWDNFYNNYPVIPPNPADFTQVIGYAGASSGNTFGIRTKGAMQFPYYNNNDAGGHQVAAWLLALPVSSTVDWTATIGFNVNMGSGSNLFTGIGAYESGSGKISCFGVANYQGAPTFGPQWYTVSAAGAGSPSSSFVGTSTPENHLIVGNVFVRIHYDHTIASTVAIYTSRDGIDWAYDSTAPYSAMNSVTQFDFIGIFFRVYIASYGGNTSTGMNVFHWSYTNP